MPNKPKYDFVIYCDDEILTNGTREECAKFLKVQPHHINHIALEKHIKKADKTQGITIAIKVPIKEVEKEAHNDN
ncbi:hypothetical protein H3984_11665 [Staphylococcus warneri]|uniref:Uncharacterized protein n=1 Tax=Staphylococcus warneri TaxID=1292 RepID=A0A2T4PXF0_STAWA|nr:hypothetical protein [Staphylococcus warneri]MBF2179203.1 hypothetical protein [Staphylococcus warneri]MBF2181594.1 hypothetical protein [Staphylococcus warneri]MBF2186100.1 hypothetical protein [Staphylococcus warneri]MBF2263469.1 hypothetical protein [Staphylococcus warneri]MBF2266185.1 hypothetical protein [Staphylococcus warneri]